MMAYIIFNHLSRAKGRGEDQRLTKGLQLLQNKISILQDLSDKTDEQVKKWVHLIESKSDDVQAQLNSSDLAIQKIESALSKALDVSKIFYEQVPHAEMTERQKTSKYVMAARLANQGFTIEQIMQKVDLSTAEIELITKMNKNELQFDEKQVPAWVDMIEQNTQGSGNTRNQEIADFHSQMSKMSQLVKSNAFETVNPDMTEMNRIKEKFTETISQNSTMIPQTFIEERAVEPLNISRTESGKIVRPFEFKKIVVNKN